MKPSHALTGARRRGRQRLKLQEKRRIRKGEAAAYFWLETLARNVLGFMMFVELDVFLYALYQ